jgi:Zn-dependent M28 family amino/carboxypeptidase
MAGRLVAVWVMVLAVLALTTLCLLRLEGPLPAWSAGAGSALAVVAGMLAARGRLRGATPGARDNASGVLAALAAAERLDDPQVGVLITGGEELGLVGARLLVRDRRALLAGTEVINFDTLDDRGPVWVVHHDERGRELARREAAKLARLGYDVRRRRLPLGILTDSLAFARMGVPAITIARLDWRTLQTIHTPSDQPDGLSLATAQRLGGALAG